MDMKALADRMIKNTFDMLDIPVSPKDASPEQIKKVMLLRNVIGDVAIAIAMGVPLDEIRTVINAVMITVEMSIANVEEEAAKLIKRHQDN
jgi:hypothetical protein